jgi:hypothetical protein
MSTWTCWVEDGIKGQGPTTRTKPRGPGEAVRAMAKWTNTFQCERLHKFCVARATASIHPSAPTKAIPNASPALFMEGTHL